MRNKEVIQKFLQHKPATGSHLYSTGLHLISYSTCIAQWQMQNDIPECYKLFINKSQYSTSTSRWQKALLKEISQGNYLVEYIDKPVYRGTPTLLQA